jgi:hypothetical protein
MDHNSHRESKKNKKMTLAGSVSLETTTVILPPQPSLYLVSAGTKTMIIPSTGVKGSFLIIHSCPTILPKRLRKCEQDDYNNNGKRVSKNKLIPQTTQIYEYVNFK